MTLSNRIAALDDPLSMTIIFDEEIWQTAGRDEVVPPNPYLQEAQDELHVADNVPTLAREIGLTPSASTRRLRSTMRPSLPARSIGSIRRAREAGVLV